MKYILIITLIIWSLVANGQEQLSLEKAISIAIDNNYQIKIDESNIRIADNNNTWARAGKTPTIGLNANFSNGYTQNSNPASFINGGFYNANLGGTVDANWTVFAGGRIEITKEQLGRLVDQQSLTKDDNLNSLIREVYQNYYSALLQEENINILQESYKLSQDRLAYENARREFGTSNAFNIIQFESALLADSINIINQHNQIATAKNTLYESMDMLGDIDYILTTPLDVTIEDIDDERLKSALREQNFTLRSLQVISDLNEINTRLASTAFKPTVNVFGSLGVTETYFKLFQKNDQGEAFPGAFGNQANVTVGANLTWTLYDGGNRRADEQNAKIQEEIAAYDILSATVALERQVDILVDNYNNQKEVILLNEQQLEVVSRNLEMAAERYKTGTISVVDYRAIQTQYLSAEFAKTNAIFNLLITKSEIDWLVGSYRTSLAQ